MATNNAINLSAPGVAYYDGAGTFSGVNGATDLVLTSTGVSTAPIYKAGVDLHTAKFIVGSGPSANFTTIAAAYAAAVSAGGNQTVFIQDGTYTENITLTSGINITGFGSSGAANGVSNVTIIGTLTFTATGTVTIYGVQLQTNSAPLLAVTGSAASMVNLQSCYLNCSNNTGITFSSSSAGSAITMKDCAGDLGTTGIALFAQTGPGLLFFYDSDFTNSGGSSTANTISAGAIGARRTAFENPLTTSGTAGLTATYSQWDTATQNVSCLTIGGSGIGDVEWCFFTSGTASSISIGSSLGIFLCEITSFNTNAVTGAGSAVIIDTIYLGSSHQTNVTTQTGGSVFGLTQGTAPSAGLLGEQIRSYIPVGSAVSLTSGTPSNITSISLTPGVWDISSNVGFVVAATTLATALQSSISTTSGTVTSNFNDDMAQYSVTAGIAGLSVSLAVPSYRQVVSTTTTYFLVALANFTISTISAIGRISATRVG